MPDEEPPRFASLAEHLEVLASAPRLELLHALRTPRALHDIRVQPGMSRDWESGERPLSRQGTTRHLERLLEASLVERRESPGGRGDVYVLNHARLFALVDEIRGLSKLRPLTNLLAAGETLTREGAEVRLPEGPRLLVAYGRDDGLAFGLHGGPGTRWRVGRAPECEIALDYDPYLSSEHAVLERLEDGNTQLEDLGSRNGTFLNWRQIKQREKKVLAPGDLITLGRSVLVYQR